MNKKFGVKAKVLGICALLSVFSVVVGVMSYFSLSHVTKSYGVIVNQTVPQVALSDQMYLNFQRVRIALRTLGLPGLSAQDAHTAVSDVKDAIARYEAANEAYIKFAFAAGQKELYQNVNSTWESFKKTGVKILGFHASGTPEARQQMLVSFLTECPVAAKQYGAAIDALVGFHQDSERAGTQEANASATRANYMSFLMVFLGLAMSLFVALSFSSKLATALQQVETALASSAFELNAAASQLSASSGSLSTTATEQAAAIQETSASIEEIRAMMEKSAQNANESAEISEVSRKHAEKGNVVVEEMIASIGQIHVSNENIMSQVMEGNRRIGEIIELIRGIGNKTKVINDIVFQTKLLSFNASVEAARAGESGKGFAVVAEEVGNLAQMSGLAAKEISDMLDGSVHRVEAIVQETRANVEGLIADSKAVVGRGGEIAKECGGVLAEIVKNARRVSEMVQEISSASQEQSRGVSEISRAIQKLDMSTQTNVAAAQETSDSSTHLVSQIGHLKSAAGQLQVVVQGQVEEVRSKMSA